MCKKNMRCKAGLSRKLCPLFVGPFIVKVVLPNDLYHVEGQRKEETVHHDRLHKCEDRALPFWIRRRTHLDGCEKQGDGDAIIAEGVNSDLEKMSLKHQVRQICLVKWFQQSAVKRKSLSGTFKLCLGRQNLMNTREVE